MQRLAIAKKFKDNAAGMLTALLVEILGKDKLRNMKARDRGDLPYEPIPTEIMAVVEGIRLTAFSIYLFIKIFTVGSFNAIFQLMAIGFLYSF